MSKSINPTGTDSCLLDTCIIIELFKGSTSVASNLDTFKVVNVSSTVIGELYFGAYASSNQIKHIRQVESFLNECTIINCDEVTALYYGRTKAVLKKLGKPIPENDIWIAALAIQYNLPLYTTDNHFNCIEELIFV